MFQLVEDVLFNHNVILCRFNDNIDAEFDHFDDCSATTIRFLNVAFSIKRFGHGCSCS